MFGKNSEVVIYFGNDFVEYITNKSSLLTLFLRFMTYQALRNHYFYTN